MPLTFTTSSARSQIDNAPQIDLAATNASHVLDVLGYTAPEQTAGICTARDFLGRVLLAMALTPHNLSYGYLHHRLHQLHDLAEFAAVNGGQVVWTRSAGDFAGP